MRLPSVSRDAKRGGGSARRRRIRCQLALATFMWDKVVEAQRRRRQVQGVGQNRWEAGRDLLSLMPTGFLLFLLHG